MAKIVPFAACRYNPARVKLQDVVTQPYDKITPAMQAGYYARSPFNLIRVEKGRAEAGDTAESNVYTRAAQTLEDWIAKGILVQDPSPAVYAYLQEYESPLTGERKLRKSFIALGRLEDYSAGIVFRHERTLAAPKADRLELLRHTRTQTGQLFMLYDDPSGRLDTLLERFSRMPTSYEAADEFGVIHRLWPIVDRETIDHIVAFMADKKLVIADGHHRYETALAFREECRAALAQPSPNAPHEFAMMTFVNLRSDGLTILPTHRVVFGLPHFDFAGFRKRVQPYFDCYAYPFVNSSEQASAEQQFRRDVFQPTRRNAIGAYAGSAFYLFLLRGNASLEHWIADASPAQRQLDVVLLHRLILEKGLDISTEAVTEERHIRYEREVKAAVGAVDRGEAQIAFLLRPLGVTQVAEMALAGEVLPQKSTDFYPKLLSGLTLYRMER